MATTTRMLQLLSLLQSRRDWPGPLLADRLDISERTVRRDVDRLREMGYRIRAIKGPDGGYRLEAGSELPPLLFDDDQAVVLAVALQSLSAGGSGFEEAASRALTTVRQVMPSRLRHRIDVLRSAISSAPRDGTASVDADTLTALASAVHAAQTLRIDYRRVGRDDEPDDGAGIPPRRIEPHHLVARGDRWYLVAWEPEREDWRTFRADRIAVRGPAGRPFRRREIPGGDVGEYLEARMKGSTGENAWPCHGRATLALPAREVTPFLGDGTVEPIDDDRCRVALGSWSWSALAAGLGRFDTDITEVEPAQLADAFAEQGRRFFAAAGGS